jgi:hypothetical protein
MNNPIQRKKNVLKFGLKMFGLEALHDTMGTELIKKISAALLKFKNFIF